MTFVEISPEQKINLLNKFNVSENESLYVFIYDTPSNDFRSAISDYNFILILGNGTKLNLSKLKDDFYCIIDVSIRNFNLANFDYFEIFSAQDMIYII